MNLLSNVLFSGKNLPCCFNYSSEIINFSEVRSFRHQSATQLCPKQEVCSDPGAPWVLDFMTHLLEQGECDEHKSSQSLSRLETP
uniref:Chemokine interleukin-8-like domain-containing protein n=1 Tax=Salarias fasciatus TaxID=181472 RepID=A0A672GW61_SALFA